MPVDSFDAVDEVLKTHYQVGRIDRLAEALEFVARHRDQLGPEPPVMVLFWFARAADLQPQAIPAYEALLAKVPAAGQSLVSTVIQLARKDSSEQLSIPLDAAFPKDLESLNRTVRNGLDLDYLWCEFFLTGNTEAIKKIVDVLKWPDRIRSRMNTWLQDPPDGALASWRKERIAKRLATATAIMCDVRIMCDVQGKRIEIDDDLDCLCMVGRKIQVRDPKEFRNLRSALPFELSDDDVNYMATKGAAKWSLIHALGESGRLEDLRTRGGDASTGSAHRQGLSTV